MLLPPASLWSWGAGDGRRGSRGLRGDGGASSVAENWGGGGQGGDPVPRWYMWGPRSGWLALRCMGAVVTPRPVTASLGDSRILWGHAAPLWGHGASLEGLAGCSGRREGGSRSHRFGVSIPSLRGVPKLLAAPGCRRDPGVPPRQGRMGPWVLRRAGKDGGGCWRRMLLTQDLPKWFLFLCRGR